MKSFSQRKGLKPLSDTIQTESMNAELRNSLWNALDVMLWSTDRIYTFSMASLKSNRLVGRYGSTFSRSLSIRDRTKLARFLRLFVIISFGVSGLRYMTF